MTGYIKRSTVLKVLGLTFVALLVLVAGYSNFTGVNSVTDPVQVGGVDIIKSMQFRIEDSLSANTATLGVITLPRAITVKQIDIYTPDAFVGAGADTAATATLRSGATSAGGTLDSGGTFSSTTVAVDFAASLQCSLLTTDGGATNTGGALGLVTVWYTDN